MALLLLSYFFEKPVHILTKSYRGQEEKEIWTLDEISGGVIDEIPLYILTSQHTVSGGEMFTYVLKNRKRATVIGEYGERRIKVEKDSLVYHKKGNPAYELAPMAKDTFSFVDESMFYVRVRFERDKSGAVNKIFLLYDAGQKDEFQKTGE